MPDPTQAVTPPTTHGRSVDRGQLYIVCLASFVVWAGFGAILPYLPVFLKEQTHASVWLIGVIAAAYFVGTFVFSTPLGRLSDTIGRKPVIVAGVVLYAVATLLFVSTTHPAWFLLFRYAAGSCLPKSSSVVRYRFVPHLVAAMCRSLAATSISADWPSRKAPTTRVRRRMSRMMRSSGLFVRICRWCLSGNA